MKGGPMVLQRHPPVYSRAEYFSDAAIHVSGIAIAVVAVPVLIVLAAIWAVDAGTLTAIAIYGACLLAMLTCSALYNMIPKPAWKDRLRRLDQSAIYLKIAGTYTPLVALTGSQAWLLLAGIWGVALAETAQHRALSGAWMGGGDLGRAAGQPRQRRQLPAAAHRRAALHDRGAVPTVAAPAASQHDLACLRAGRDRAVLRRGHRGTDQPRRVGPFTQV